MKNRYLLIPILIFFFTFYFNNAEARRGCCSWHGGVCTYECPDGDGVGYRCCDGSSLSAKCAPYYPSCSSNLSTTPKTQKPKLWIPKEQKTKFKRINKEPEVQVINGENPDEKDPKQFHRLYNDKSENQTELQQKKVIYHGNMNSKIFHKPRCQYYNCKNCTAFFDNRERAINSGFRPCKVCKP